MSIHFLSFFGENFIIYGTFCNYCHYFRNFIDFFRPNPRFFTELFAVLGITSVILTLFSCSYHGEITELFAILAITSVIPTLFSCSKLQKTTELYAKTSVSSVNPNTSIYQRSQTTQLTACRDAILARPTHMPRRHPRQTDTHTTTKHTPYRPHVLRRYVHHIAL